MKAIWIVVVFATFSFQTNAQQFKKLFTVQLDESLSSMQGEWVSMNADTLLDFFVAGVAGNQLKVSTYDSGKTKVNTMLTGMKSGFVQVADWNRDNKMDLLISGKTLIDTDGIFLFTGNGDFTFTKQPMKLIEHSGEFRIGDFNNDALPDLLTFGPSFIRIYKNSINNGLSKSFELTNLNATDIVVFDMNRDGLNDFVVSGVNTTSIFFNESKLQFTKVDAPSPVDGGVSLADTNNDGFFDVIVAGKTGSAVWLNDGESLTQDQVFNGNLTRKVFTGDITSDGVIDIISPGSVRELAGTGRNIDSVELILQRMGDHDRDGLLDLIQLTDSIGSQWIKFHKNITPLENKRPGLPSTGFAISTFNKTYIFWQGATDDHTSTNSITYDVWLGSNQANIITPSFDLSNSQRTVVTHGNAGTRTSMIIDGLTDNRYFYNIQAVDNAYNGSRCLGGGVLPCFDLVHNNVQACKGTTVNLAGGDNAIWFSVSKGFLGQTSSLNFVANAADTLFAFAPQGADCSKNKVYVVNVHEGQKADDETLYACLDKTIPLSIDAGWTNIIWDTTPAQSTSTISYHVTGPDTVRVSSINTGCEYRKNFYIRISKPEVTISGDGFQVMRGNSVQLNATGNVTQWLWEPATGLDNSTIPTPAATPDITTEYILTGTDSIGCTASDTTHVIVVETAFIPNLFTPNGDGKNDNIMIYGLANASRFEFKIFNREGTKVYETKDVSHAATVGWNGSIGGVRQPSGLYYWKVQGEMPDGSKVLLNGKATGSILLVH